MKALNGLAACEAQNRTRFWGCLDFTIRGLLFLRTAPPVSPESSPEGFVQVWRTCRISLLPELSVAPLVVQLLAHPLFPEPLNVIRHALRHLATIT